jgi:hypothetical protein
MLLLVSTIVAASTAVVAASLPKLPYYDPCIMSPGMYARRPQLRSNGLTKNKVEWSCTAAGVKTFAEREDGVGSLVGSLPPLLSETDVHLLDTNNKPIVLPRDPSGYWKWPRELNGVHPAAWAAPRLAHKWALFSFNGCSPCKAFLTFLTGQLDKTEAGDPTAHAEQLLSALPADSGIVFKDTASGVNIRPPNLLYQVYDNAVKPNDPSDWLGVPRVGSLGYPRFACWRADGIARSTDLVSSEAHAWVAAFRAAGTPGYTSEYDKYCSERKSNGFSCVEPDSCYRMPGSLSAAECWKCFILRMYSEYGCSKAKFDFEALGCGKQSTGTTTHSSGGSTSSAPNAPATPSWGNFFKQLATDHVDDEASLMASEEPLGAAAGDDDSLWSYVV